MALYLSPRNRRIGLLLAAILAALLLLGFWIGERRYLHPSLVPARP